ncbi:MAG: hypothetical protein AABY18_05990 [Candidatus Thermoplasmatota archaeon]
MPKGKRPSLFEGPPRSLRALRDSELGPAGYALLIAAAIAVLKLLMHGRGWELDLVGLPVLAALIGAVTFTLAIVLSGVLADFKEAERGLGEIVSGVRRLHWDFAFAGADEKTVAALRLQLAHFVNMVLENARHGSRWRLRDLHSPIDAMDRMLTEAVAVRPLPTTRTAQMGLASLTRNVDRVETIVETTFMAAGYIFSATSIALVVGCLLLTDLGSATSGALVTGAVAFVLCGLYLLVRDLDNPMAGSVRLKLTQVEKLAAFLKERADTEAGKVPTLVRQPTFRG